LVLDARAEPGKYTWSATPGQTAVIVPAFLKLAGIDMLRVSSFDPSATWAHAMTIYARKRLPAR
jgi:hypothetical protein